MLLEKGATKLRGFKSSHPDQYLAGKPASDIPVNIPVKTENAPNGVPLLHPSNENPLVGSTRSPKSQTVGAKALKEGMETILKSLQGMFKAVLQFEMPEVLTNGDIIIRRNRRIRKRPTT